MDPDAGARAARSAARALSFLRLCGRVLRAARPATRLHGLGEEGARTARSAARALSFLRPCGRAPRVRRKVSLVALRLWSGCCFVTGPNVSRLDVCRGQWLPRWGLTFRGSAAGVPSCTIYHTDGNSCVPRPRNTKRQPPGCLPRPRIINSRGGADAMSFLEIEIGLISRTSKRQPPPGQ